VFLGIPFPSVGYETTLAVAGADPTFLTFRTDAPVERILAVGAMPVEAYDSFLITRGTAETIRTLRDAGFRADVLPDAGSIHLAAGTLDAGSLGKSSAPWTRDARGFGIGIVHVYAPLKESWRVEWEARGVEILRYLPTNAFLVRGPVEALRGLSTLPYVDGLGPFDPAWKVRPGTPSLGDRVDVRIVLLPGERGDSLLAFLSHRGLSRVDRAGAEPGIVGTFGNEDFRWVRARIPGNLVTLLASRPDVEFIEPVARLRPLNAEMAWVLQTNRIVTSNSTRDERYRWNGLDGRGQTIGVSDTGLDYDHDAFRHSSGFITLGDLYNTTDAGRRKVVRYLNMGFLTGRVDWPGGTGTWDPSSIRDSDHTPGGSACTFGHGTAVSSVLAGNDNWRVGGGGPNDGLASGAKIYLQDIGTVGPDPTSPCPGDIDLLNYLPEDFADLFGPPGLVYNDPDAPVRIHSDSWGSDVNEYDIQARMIDAFVWDHPDFTVLFASGNSGSAAGSVDAPATAKNLVTVGGAGNPDASVLGTPNDVILLSSRGPTSDGRLKPTVLGIFDGDSSMSDGDPRSGAGEADDHWAGTSYATPSAAAAAAIVRQYFADGWYPSARPVPGNVRLPSAALVRAVLIASGVQLTCSSGCVRPGVDTWPNNEQGFGRILLSNVLPLAAASDTFRTQIVDGTVGLLSGEDAVHTFRVTGTRTLKVVLTWSDYPAAVSAARALVNDLDLEVVAPDGTLYRGNNFGTFLQGASQPDGVSDTTNVEEAVILKTPASGEWTVRVRASNVPVGPQPYALVATGDLDPDFGRVSVDRQTYGPGDTVGIEVDDANAPSVEVRLSSNFESAGELIPLSRSGPDEIWRGSAVISFGPTSAAGVQVRDGDTVRVEYVDPSPAHTAVATARIDAVGPAIFDVAADRPGPASTRIRWRTDEGATSGIWYGTTATALTGFTEDRNLRTMHDLSISGLVADTLYYYDVAARDRHGQETRDTNGGRHFRFLTDRFGDVLLVLADDSFPPEREPSWSNALDSNGWTWSLWKVADAGLPSLPVLQVHLAVLWQVGLEQYPPFDGPERDLIRQYLDEGGRLLVTSHDTAWALSEPTSEFYSAEADMWVRSTLRASFLCDPLTVGRLRGLTGDPISGPYTGGIGYLAHRDGGAVDGFTRLPAGGTTTSVWTDEVVSPTNCAGQDVGLRWVSSLANGTLGVGVWGGHPSRLAYFAFELTSVDTTSSDLRPTSPVRAGVIDNTIRWLVADIPSGLDRDHPSVTVTAPNGGTFGGPTVPVNWTAASTGAAIGEFEVAYSEDGGASWTRIATVPGTARSHAWDVDLLPNGDRYLVRVLVRDAGTPTLTGRDESDGFLAIRRPTGDALGPTIWAGSVRIAPNPPGVARAVWVQATADDRLSGGGAILGAELFFAAAEPLSGANGSGTPMDPADGTFDGPVENVTWLDVWPLASGPTCAWVHARDAGGTWGPFGSTCFDAIDVGGPDTTSPVIVLTDPRGPGNVSGMISVNATASDDDAVRRVELRIDGSLVAMDASFPFSFRLNTTNFTNGPHRVAVVAVDLAGNTASDEVLLTFANGPGSEPTPFPFGIVILAIAIPVTIVAVLLVAYLLRRPRPPRP